jgi:hypothetical protein
MRAFGKDNGYMMVELNPLGSEPAVFERGENIFWGELCSLEKI